MDQFISAMGVEGHALLIDCRSYVPTPVPLADPSLAIVIVNSNETHELVGGEYNKLRQQCETAVELMQAARPGIELLRDADMADLNSLPDNGSDVFRRARHVITENERTLSAMDAMRVGDYTKVGQLMFASHESLDKDFDGAVVVCFQQWCQLHAHTHTHKR